MAVASFEDASLLTRIFMHFQGHEKEEMKYETHLSSVPRDICCRRLLLPLFAATIFFFAFWPLKFRENGKILSFPGSPDYSRLIKGFSVPCGAFTTELWENVTHPMASKGFVPIIRSVVAKLLRRSLGAAIMLSFSCPPFKSWLML